MDKLDLKDWLGTALVHVEKVTTIRPWKQWCPDCTSKRYVICLIWEYGNGPKKSCTTFQQLDTDQVPSLISAPCVEAQVAIDSKSPSITMMPFGP